MLQRTPGSLLDFAAWLETKDPTEKYVWNNWAICACGQYFRERGCFNEWQFHPERYSHLNGLAQQVTRAQRRTVRGWWNGHGKELVGTFGDLLDVVRKELNA